MVVKKRAVVGSRESLLRHYVEQSAITRGAAAILRLSPLERSEQSEGGEEKPGEEARHGRQGEIGGVMA